MAARPTFEAQVRRHIQQEREFERRVEPALHFFEEMLELGLRDHLPGMLRQYAQNQALRDLIEGRRKWWQLRSIQLGFGVAIVQLLLTTGLALLNFLAMHAGGK
jgi:hypothetical protein